MRRQPDGVATPRERKELRKETYLIRKKFGLEREKYFEIVLFLELILPRLDPLFVLDPVEDSELIGRAAETIPEQHLIRVKQSIYDAACSGNYWARFVLAHELAHYILHGNKNVAYAYLDPNEKIPRTMNPERQADVFASELLVPVNLITESDEYLVSKHFGVPRSTARIQMGQANRIRRRHEQKKLTSKKKNG
ncbi:MAG: ImmA/IrrE family metallo-endopeptidase [Oscillospiraceae bacterium]|nr:ImmA/IrrE family metallo-endopeptidase [Oscillospiraceae bacterium]